AIAACKEAVRLREDFPEAHYHLGNALQLKGRQGEARAEWERAVRYKPDHAAAHNNLALLLASIPDPRPGGRARAVLHARMAVQLRPDDGRCWRALGVAQYRNGDWEGAAQALAKANRLNRGGEVFDWLYLAMAHWRLGHEEQARAWYARAVAG